MAQSSRARRACEVRKRIRQVSRTPGPSLTRYFLPQDLCPTCRFCLTLPLALQVADSSSLSSQLNVTTSEKPSLTNLRKPSWVTCCHIPSLVSFLARLSIISGLLVTSVFRCLALGPTAAFCTSLL